MPGLPIPLPPAAVPGTAENKALTEATVRAIQAASEAVSNVYGRCAQALGRAWDRMFSENGEKAGAGKECSPVIKPSDVAGKSPGEIDQLATGAGLKPQGPDPQNGRGAYVDPVTGEQRVLVHGDHAHVNDPAGNRLDVNGNVVPPNSPEAHLPLKKP